MAAQRMYRVSFINQGQVYEIYARQVSHGSMMGFVEVEQLTFGERTQVVVDPGEERLKSEFAGVKRTFIPLHAVIRIDEVEKEGPGKISEATGKVTPFPVQYFGPGGGSRD